MPELPPLAYTTPVAVIFNALKSSYPVPGLSLITIVPFDSIAILEATTLSQWNPILGGVPVNPLEEDLNSTAAVL